MPALNPAGETETVRVEGAVPDVGDTLSHAALLTVAVQLPPFVISTDCDAGAGPPAVAANCRLDGETAIVAGTGTMIVV